MNSANPRIVVVGGGLAGLSAALECADGGASVTLLEARPRLGGATWSFERHGLRFDNGQHVHLRCCEGYRSFLERLGTSAMAPFRGPLALPVLRPSAGGRPSPRVAWIRRDGLPAPAHLARSLLLYAHIPLHDRMRLLTAVAALRAQRLDDPRLDEESFGEWLARHGQGERAVSALFDLITLPTTNLRSSEVSLALGAKVFKTGLLTRSAAADMAWSDVPLASLHVDPAERLLESLGASVLRRCKVSEVVLAPSDGTVPVVRGVIADGRLLECDALILAVPHDAAAELLPDAATAGLSEAVALHRLGSVPIVNVHLVFDREVMPYRVAAAVDSPVQFVFDRTTASGLRGATDPQIPEQCRRQGQVLAVSVSGADAEIGERPEVLISRYRQALSALFPVATQAKLVDAVVTREHEATFRGTPGTGKLRIGPATGLPNLLLAGAWTDTGWPATMEGAVRSGRSAAASALRKAAELQGSLPSHEEVLT
jgi:squalene-associated FAD-dependent desaturase